MAKSAKSAVKDDVRSLSGAERAAVIMLSLGEEHSAKIWSLMDEEEVKEVSQVMSNLGSISSNVIEKLLVDFVSQMSGTGSLMGSYESTERLIARFMPQDKVAQIMEEIRGPAGRTMWDKLANVNESVLANYLKNEYPQTVSVVLSKIKPEHAARVLGALPEEFALEVVQRMLRMESVQKDILDKVEQTLRVEFMSNLARTAKRDSHEHMAEIFNNFDRQTESRFITALEERSRDSAERIKALMFTFEDLGKLDPGSIQTLLRHIEKDKLGLALKGATDGLRDVFFTNMS
ncbi:MAG TPA: flagellar motor switch protein FliG, partial [Rhizomicrobium sp.]|nr:flagellar motor switch protein FliG [Rhizomicrobium sp.]